MHAADLEVQEPCLQPGISHCGWRHDAVALIHPVFTPAGNFTGAVSATFKPGVFLGNIIAPKINGTPYSAFLVQKDGRILYDPDPSEVGKMTFEDPLYKAYPSLLKLAKIMARSDRARVDTNSSKKGSRGTSPRSSNGPPWGCTGTSGDWR